MEILSIIVSWPEDVITFFVLLVTLVSAYSFKENKYINKWASIILFTIIFAIPFNVFDVFYDEFNLYLIMLIGCSLLYALLFVNYDLKNVMTTFVSCLFTFVSIKGCIGILLSLTLSSYVSQYSFNFFSALLYYLAIIAVSAFYKRHALKSTSVQPYSYWFFMFLAPVLIYTADRLQILSYFSIWGSYRVQSFYGLLQEFVLCFLIVLVYYLSYLMIRNFDHFMEVSMLNQRQALQLEHLERSAALVEQLRRDKHEMKNLFFYLQAELQLKKYDDLETFVEHNLSQRYDRLEEFNTGNKFVDYLLTQKANEAKDSNIKFMADVQLPPEISIEENDLCSLLMNLMDNAIDACRKEKNGDIQLQIHTDSQYLYISIKNCSSVDVLKSNPLLITSKKDSGNHGIGMRVIRSIVTKYQGYFQNHWENGLYVVDIMLTL